MHLGIPALLDFYRSHREDDALVLVTIIATEGSTYRKTGAMMLISSSVVVKTMGLAASEFWLWKPRS